MDSRAEAREELSARNQIIQKNLSLIRSTRDLFQEYAQELKTSLDRFTELEDSLQSSKLRIAVLGEFSRGKSTLLNALLGIEQLPTAQEATTAINTFIYGLPDGVSQEFIRIIYKDDRQEDIPLTHGDQQALKIWGTELEKGHRDARQEVSHIEVYINHDLLNLGLTLIDKPGLEGIHEHHENITRQAINQAHMAIWVQSAQQLGGTRNEWLFMRDTLKSNFRKFITVINWWDLVLDPQDKTDKEKTLAEREREKLDTVRKNFHDTLPDMSPEEYKILTGPENLFGVSARWAQSDDEEKRTQSGMDKLMKRVRQIAKSPEDREEIYHKPLKSLEELQKRLEAHLRDKLAIYSNTDSLEKQKHDLERLQNDIKQLELEKKSIEQDARMDHDRLAENNITAIREDLLAPIKNLQSQIEDTLTVDYVRKQMKGKNSVIELPPDTQDLYDHTIAEINDKWAQQKAAVQETLRQLRLNFEEKMNNKIGFLDESLQNLKINMPPLDVKLAINIDQFEEYYHQQSQLEQQVRKGERELDELELKKIEHAEDRQALETAREKILRAEKILLAHGSRPQPRITEREVELQSAGVYRSAKYGTVQDVDDSNVRKWEEANEQYQADLADKEAHLERIMAEEEKKRKMRMTVEAAERQRQKELKNLERDLEKLQAQLTKSMDDEAERLFNNLKRNTIGQLDSLARALEKNGISGTKDMFNQHLKYLIGCVEEQYEEPLKASEQSRAEAIASMERDQREVEAMRNKIEEALTRINALREETANALGAK